MDCLYIAYAWWLNKYQNLSLNTIMAYNFFDATCCSGIFFIQQILKWNVIKYIFPVALEFVIKNHATDHSANC